jgi:hypothetical protein
MTEKKSEQTNSLIRNCKLEASCHDLNVPSDDNKNINTSTRIQSTVKPRFTNLIRSWRSFVTRNYFPRSN